MYMSLYCVHTKIWFLSKLVFRLKLLIIKIYLKIRLTLTSATSVVTAISLLLYKVVGGFLEPR